MTITDESFFQDNVVNINKKINLILFCADLVPIAFVILTYIGIWYVPTGYAAIIFVYDTIFSVLCFLLNRSPKKSVQILSMYAGLIGVSMFVFLLGMKGVIVVTISFAFASFLSCLYYNRSLTFIITTINFVLMIVAYWLRSSSVTLVLAGVKTAERWFIESVPGAIIEFIFVFLVADTLARRTSKTMRRLMSMNEDITGAYRRLNEKNVTQFNINKELQEKNDFITKQNAALSSSNQAFQENQIKFIDFVAKCLGAHDEVREQHIEHIGKYVKEICEELRNSGNYTDVLDDENIARMALASTVHDIGKINIPADDAEQMKNHPMEGRKLLEFLPPIEEGKFNVTAKEMALYHHEKWDGSGYPYGLSEDAIPLSARIMAAADALDSMPAEKVLKFFEKEKGKQFDPCIAEAVIRLNSNK